jgi:hypothetical protein
VTPGTCREALLWPPTKELFNIESFTILPFGQAFWFSFYSFSRERIHVESQLWVSNTCRGHIVTVAGFKTILLVIEVCQN